MAPYASIKVWNVPGSDLTCINQFPSKVFSESNNIYFSLFCGTSRLNDLQKVILKVKNEMKLQNSHQEGRHACMCIKLLYPFLKNVQKAMEENIREESFCGWWGFACRGHWSETWYIRSRAYHQWGGRNMRRPWERPWGYNRELGKVCSCVTFSSSLSKCHILLKYLPF